MWMASSLNRLLAFFTYLGPDHHLRIPIRGGSWNNTSNAGVFKLTPDGLAAFDRFLTALGCEKL